MCVHIDFKGSWYAMPISKTECRQFIRQVANKCGLEDIILEIVVCGDRSSISLNENYLNAKSPTNILSFNAEQSRQLMQVTQTLIPSSLMLSPLTSDASELSENCLPKQKNRAVFIGSLVISSDTLQREAFLYGQDPLSYTKQLIIHGFAHLLGYDHGQEMDIFCEQFLSS